MQTRFIGRPAPIYMLGDSQCLVFSQLLFEAQYQDKTVSLLTQARYCPGLSAAQFSDARAYLHETVIRALLSDCLIDRENRALYQHQSSQSGILPLLAGRTRAAPVLVFFCGSSDLVNGFQRQLGTHYDFVLPDQEHLLAAFPPAPVRQVFPYQTARASLNERLEPLFRGLRKLREMGFVHIYLHDLAPQTPDDLFFSRVYQYSCPARIRCKAQLLFNQLLAERAQSEGFGLVQIWDQVTEDNRLRPEFALDSIHLNKAAAFLSAYGLELRLVG